MTDRLPVPLPEHEDARVAERASASVSATTAPGDEERSRGEGVPSPTPAGAAASDVPRRLPDIQSWMLEAILGPPPDGSVTAAVLTAGPRSSAAERLEIYRFGYTARLVECLADDYPVLRIALGEPRFRALALAYIEHNPSRSPNLNAYGARMKGFLRDAAPQLLDGPRQFFSELAELEWALIEAIHAPPESTLDAVALQAIAPDAWGRARLTRGATVRLLRFTHPVNAYFQQIRAGAGDTPLPEAAPSATAVYRHAQRLWRMDLTPAMTRVLVSLLEERTIAESLAQMAVDESDPEAIAEAERSVIVWFREWASSGFFSGVLLDS